MNALAQWLKLPGAALEADDDYRAINRLFVERGWGDGLPIMPPTADAVEEMLTYCDRPWDEPVAKIPPRYGEATPLRLATNAVMAGCRPEYFPLIVLAVEAMCEEPLNLYALQATTHPVAPLVIVNGPIAKALGLNGGYNAFGPGNPANATIGRAIRLALLNIGGAIPGLGDMSTMGSPAKYTYLVAENEAENPWQPLHVERGLPRDATSVTVIGGEAPHNVNDHQSITGEGILKMVAGTLATTGNNDVYNVRPQPLVIFGPEHAKTVADDGYGKDDVKRFIHEHARVPLGKFSKENIERRFKVTFRAKYANAGMDETVPIFQRAEDLLVAVIGGPGKHSAVVPTFGATQPVTRALKTRGGELARSIEDFRQP
jgi:hypothetical protein